jgi:2-C-methyl-D-erythritol 4-phosphate cytidylyltransferase
LNNSVWAVVPAAGKGARMGADIPKQYLKLAGKSVLEHTLQLLTSQPLIAAVVIAVAADDELWPAVAASLSNSVTVVTGGAERCHSVLAGITALDNAGDDDWVMVHDAARPCLRASDIERMIDELGEHPVGGILAAPVRDTLKRGNEHGDIVATVDRNHLWHALTPQMFRVGVLRSAIAGALDRGLVVTDEAQAIEAAGLVPRIVEGHGDNLKITHPADLTLAELILRGQGRV